MKPICKAYGDCEGPLGVPMRSDVAKEVDRLIAGLPSDCKELIKDGPVRLVKMAASMELKPGERDDISLITTNSVDRDREVMLAEGGNFDQLRKAGMPVTFAHDYAALPVGRGKWIKRVKDQDANGWLARTHYIEKPDSWTGDWFPDAVCHYVMNDLLRGKSIGFIPTKIHYPTPDEIKKRPELADCRVIHEQWIAIEWAVAPVQCNPDAVVVAAAKAVKTLQKSLADLNGRLGLHLPEDVAELSAKDFTTVAEQTPAPAAQQEPVILVKDVRAQVQKAVQDILGRVPEMVKEAIDTARGRV